MGDLQSIKELKLCPHGIIWHIYHDHPDEITECDNCRETKMCKITCESFVLYKMCNDCIIYINEMETIV